MIRVLLVDDQALIRQAIKMMLELAGGIEVVGQAETGLQAVSMSKALRPDVVLMDIRMPELNGIEATEKICGDPQLSDTRVLILTTFENDTNVVSALRAGASGFVGKGSEPEDLVRAVQAIAAGDSLLSPSATRSLIERVVSPAQPGHSHGSLDKGIVQPLTEREQEILALVGKGLTNQEIADQLVISIHTAKTHVGRVMTKLDAHDRAQLVIAAYESGLIEPGNH